VTVEFILAFFVFWGLFKLAHWLVTERMPGLHKRRWWDDIKPK